MGQHWNPISVGEVHVKYPLQFKWLQRDFTQYFTHQTLHEDVWLVYSKWIHSQIVLLRCCLWFQCLVALIAHSYLPPVSNTFRCNEKSQLYFTNIILSCSHGVFECAFESPPAQWLLLRGPVSQSVGIREVAAHCAGHLTETTTASHENENQEYSCFARLSLLLVFFFAAFLCSVPAFLETLTHPLRLLLPPSCVSSGTHAPSRSGAALFGDFERCSH